ncbi:sigma-70 family RNA polymerase sigma factor [Baekduia sp. Peel2402]|uniref:sigma-70 family RNA polymerase sigma factor n=1 Tax=Baekduia sp. Peel2402 TaxID=3458296 RepID=UPI00403E8C4A
MRIPDAEELWRRFGAGDGSAFTQLYSDHHRDVVRYCRSLLRDEQDAQDAAQGTWTAIWTRPDAARRDVPLRPWLFRVAHNESVTIIRRRRPHDPLSDLDLPALDDVASDVELRDRLATLRADLVDLPERQRVALLSRELGGLGHAEIAEALGISVGAAKQTIYEARRALVEAESGRSMACDAVQRAISDGDGRVRRGRRVGAHLRACESCRTFADAVGRRRRELRLLFPAPAALSLLARIAAGMGAGGAGGTVVATSGSVATKLAATAAVIAVAGTGVQHELADPGRADAKGPAAPHAVAVAVAAAPARTASPSRLVLATARTTAPPGSARQRPAPGTPSSAASSKPPRAAGRHRPPAGAVPVTAPVEVPVAAQPVSARPDHGASGPARADKTKAKTPPGQAKKVDGAKPPGQAKKVDGAKPPGQAKKADGAQPPGQAKKTEAAEPPGQAKKTDEAKPPGQAKKTDAAAASPPTSPPASDGAAAPSDMPPGHAKAAPPGHGKP